MEFDAKPKLKQHSQVHAEKLSYNLCEKKMVHTINQDENNFMSVLCKKYCSCKAI